MSMKLPNGYGSVTKLSGRRRNPYMARVTLGRDDYGMLVRKSIGYYRTRKEALAALAEYNRDPYDLSAAKVTFGDMYAQWIARYSQTVTPAVVAKYTYLYKICEPIADKPMSDLKLIQLQTLIDSVDLKPTALNQLKSLLNLVFKYAIKLDVIQTNYAERIDTGKQPKTQNPHVPFLPDEITLLWQHADVFAIKLALILIYSGMRAGELFAMRTEDVHLDDGYMIGGSKTDAGKNRIIPIHHKILPLIQSLYNPDAPTLVYPSMTRNTYTPHFNTALHQIGLDGHRTHDCRHTFASLMDEAGANRSALKRIMGHAGGDVTDAVYIHKTVDNLKKEIELITI